MSNPNILPLVKEGRLFRHARWHVASRAGLPPDNAVGLTADIRQRWERFRHIGATHVPVGMETRNLGDDVQAEAAARFWGVRDYVNRDRLAEWPRDAVVPMVGWYASEPLVPAAATCVVVGFHLESESRSAFASTKFRDWFGAQVRGQGFPAQCRDLATRDFLRSVGIDAEFLGCISYTLATYSGPRDGGVVVVDAKVPWTRRLGRTLTLPQENPRLAAMSAAERLAAASERIEQLARAKHVHTIRLHTLLPCRALGTPVTFYPSQVSFQPDRFSGHVA